MRCKHCGAEHSGAKAISARGLRRKDSGRDKERAANADDLQRIADKLDALDPSDEDSDPTEQQGKLDAIEKELDDMGEPDDDQTEERDVIAALRDSIAAAQDVIDKRPDNRGEDDPHVEAGSGDVEVGSYERNGHTVSAYSRSRRGGKAVLNYRKEYDAEADEVYRSRIAQGTAAFQRALRDDSVTMLMCETWRRVAQQIIDADDASPTMVDAAQRLLDVVEEADRTVAKSTRRLRRKGGDLRGRLQETIDYLRDLVHETRPDPDMLRDTIDEMAEILADPPDDERLVIVAEGLLEEARGMLMRAETANDKSTRRLRRKGGDLRGRLQETIDYLRDLVHETRPDPDMLRDTIDEMAEILADPPDDERLVIVAEGLLEEARGMLMRAETANDKSTRRLRGNGKSRSSAHDVYGR